MKEVVVVVLELFITLAEDQVLSDRCEVHEGVLADLVAVPNHLYDVLYLLVPDYIEELILVDYVENIAALQVLVDEHVVDLSLILYVLQELKDE